MTNKQYIESSTSQNLNPRIVFWGLTRSGKSFLWQGMQCEILSLFDDSTPEQSDASQNKSSHQIQFYIEDGKVKLPDTTRFVELKRVLSIQESRIKKARKSAKQFVFSESRIKKSKTIRVFSKPNDGTLNLEIVSYSLERSVVRDMSKDLSYQVSTGQHKIRIVDYPGILLPGNQLGAQVEAFGNPEIINQRESVVQIIGSAENLILAVHPGNETNPEIFLNCIETFGNILVSKQGVKTRPRRIAICATQMDQPPDPRGDWPAWEDIDQLQQKYTPSYKERSDPDKNANEIYAELISKMEQVLICRFGQDVANKCIQQFKSWSHDHGLWVEYFFTQAVEQKNQFNAPTGLYKPEGMLRPLAWLVSCIEYQQIQSQSRQKRGAYYIFSNWRRVHQRRKQAYRPFPVCFDDR